MEGRKRSGYASMYALTFLAIGLQSNTTARPPSQTLDTGLDSDRVFGSWPALLTESQLAGE